MKPWFLQTFLNQDSTFFFKNHQLSKNGTKTHVCNVKYNIADQQAHTPSTGPRRQSNWQKPDIPNKYPPVFCLRFTRSLRWVVALQLFASAFFLHQKPRFLMHTPDWIYGAEWAVMCNSASDKSRGTATLFVFVGLSVSLEANLALWAGECIDPGLMEEPLLAPVRSFLSWSTCVIGITDVNKV